MFTREPNMGTNKQFNDINNIAIDIENIDNLDNIIVNDNNENNNVENNLIIDDNNENNNDDNINDNDINDNDNIVDIIEEIAIRKEKVKQYVKNKQTKAQDAM
jgi:hypothetical protein